MENCPESCLMKWKEIFIKLLLYREMFLFSRYLFFVKIFNVNKIVVGLNNNMLIVGNSMKCREEKEDNLCICDYCS